MEISKLFKVKGKEVNKKIEDRISRELTRNQGRLIDKLEAQQDKIFAEREALEILSSDMLEKDIDTWNERYQAVLERESILGTKIAIAKATEKKYFNE